MLRRKLLRIILLFFLLTSLHYVIFAMAGQGLFFFLLFFEIFILILVKLTSYKILNYFYLNRFSQKDPSVDVQCLFANIFQKMRLPCPKIFLMRSQSGIFDFYGTSPENVAFYVDEDFFKIFEKQDIEQMIAWRYLSLMHRGYFQTTLFKIILFPLTEITEKYSVQNRKSFYGQNSYLFSVILFKGLRAIFEELTHSNTFERIVVEIENIFQSQNRLMTISSDLRGQLLRNQKSLLLERIFKKLGQSFQHKHSNNFNNLENGASKA